MTMQMTKFIQYYFRCFVVIFLAYTHFFLKAQVFHYSWVEPSAPDRSSSYCETFKWPVHKHLIYSLLMQHKYDFCFPFWKKENIFQIKVLCHSLITPINLFSLFDKYIHIELLKRIYLTRIQMHQWLLLQLKEILLSQNIQIDLKLFNYGDTCFKYKIHQKMQ